MELKAKLNVIQELYKNNKKINIEIWLALMKHTRKIFYVKISLFKWRKNDFFSPVTLKIDNYENYFLSQDSRNIVPDNDTHC